MNITNVTGISLPLAVWLVADAYDFHPNGTKAISATALLKPVRRILLQERLTEETQETPDVSNYIASRMGHSIHDSIEQAWRHNYKDSLRKLGYPEDIIGRVVINPEDPSENAFPVYLEKRSYKTCMGYTISGKFDMVLNGELHDFKSTSAYSWVFGSKDEDFKLQGSIYRWLNPEIITEDHMYIQYIFTDWSKAQAKQNPDYPQQRVIPHRIELLSIAETDAWIKSKLRSLEAVADKPEPELPFCSDEDLWKGETVWKYYSNPAKTDGRSTKNCKSLQEANDLLADKGKGVVIEVPGKVKACSYCNAFPICSQKDLYEHG